MRLAASKLGYKLSRNNCGSFKDGNRWIKFGVFNPGGADLIGFKTMTITPDMIGGKVAVFTAIEVKAPTGKLKPEQEHFLKVIRESGGIAVVARSPDDLLKS